MEVDVVREKMMTANEKIQKLEAKGITQNFIKSHENIISSLIKCPSFKIRDSISAKFLLNITFNQT